MLDLRYLWQKKTFKHEYNILSDPVFEQQKHTKQDKEIYCYPFEICKSKSL